MSNSALIKSSIAKKYWMALTGLFLCLFLVGHLIGNLQLIIKTGEEGRRAFNEYAYFMTHNPTIMVVPICSIMCNYLCVVTCNQVQKSLRTVCCCKTT